MNEQDPVVVQDSLYLYFDTGISQRIFAQAKLMQTLDGQGLIVSPSPGAPEQFSCSAWQFEGTKPAGAVPAFRENGKTEQIVLYGAAFGGVPLSGILTDTSIGVKERAQTLAHVLGAMDWALRSGMDLPAPGPCGTFVRGDGRVLFLPDTLFARVLEMKNDETYSRLYGAWTAPGLPAPEKYLFAAAAYVYCLFACKTPYPSADTAERTSDMYDANFEPLKLILPDKPPYAELARITDTCLSLYGKPDRKRRRRPEAPGFGELKDALCAAAEQMTEDGNAVCASGADGRLEEFRSRQRRSIKRRRFMRKNRGVLAGAAAAFLCFLAVTALVISDVRAKPTTENMTPLEVTEMFYQGIHTLDQSLIDACVTGSAGKEYTDLVTNLYVIGKVRQAYERTQGIMTPEQWLSTETPQNHSVFGLTNLKIEEAGGMQSEDRAVFTVSFYMLLPQPPETDALPLTADSPTADAPYPLSVYSRTDTVTLSRKRGSWRISGVTTERDDPVPVDTEAFFHSYEKETPPPLEWAPGNTAAADLR